MRWHDGAVDSSYTSWQRDSEGIAHGRVGKGILIHRLTDTADMPLVTSTTPAHEDEWASGLPLLDALHAHTGTCGRPGKRLRVLVADQSSDAKGLRQRMRQRRMSP
jgi:hypothetical protein